MNMRHRRGHGYLDEELLNELKRFKKENGRLPTSRDFINNPEYPHFNTIRDRFESWNKALEKAFGINRRKGEKYTDGELLDILVQFEIENGRPPTEKDFANNPILPSIYIYQNRFGSWIKALILAGLDVDLDGKQGDKYRSREAEVKVINHFKECPIDLSGENAGSPFDGICPNGLIYDVKSSRLHRYRGDFYQFGTHNKYKEHIQIYYLLALNDDGSIKYVWRIPGEIAETNSLRVGFSSDGKFNIKNMEKYNITDKFKIDNQQTT